METTQIITPDKIQIIGYVIGILFALVIAAGALLLLWRFMKQIQNGQGPMGSVLRASRDLGKERLEVERELLAAQKETNELLKQIIAKQKP